MIKNKNFLGEHVLSSVPAVHIELSFLLCIALSAMQRFHFAASVRCIPSLQPMAGFEVAKDQRLKIEKSNSWWWLILLSYRCFNS